MTDLWGREGPRTPGDDIVTDGRGRRVNQWIVEQVTILRVKHSLVCVVFWSYASSIHSI